MHDYLFYLALTSAIFAGAVVSGFAGFAFSAVAGVILMHLLAPHEAVPLMMACSVAVQLIGIVMLRSCMNWRSSLPFLAGGAAGIPPAVYLLHHMDTWTLRIGFGLFIAAYACYGRMLVCPDIFAFLQKGRPAGAASPRLGFRAGCWAGLRRCLARRRPSGATCAACPRTNSAASSSLTL